MGHQDDAKQSKERKASASESTMPEEVPGQKNIEAITSLERKSIGDRSSAEQIADRVTKGAGSTPFIVLHLFWFGGWILGNGGLIPGVTPFDPFPFSLLTLIVSLEAIFLTLLVLMSQKRMTKEADKRAHLDIQLNMLAEQEGTVVLRMVQRIGKHLGLEEEAEESAQQLAEDTDVNRLAKVLDEKLPN
jgi:uncharacterized membrane protein